MSLRERTRLGLGIIEPCLPSPAKEPHESQYYLLMRPFDPPFEKSRVPSVINLWQLVMN
jgi:hypothetical protein